MSDAIQNTLIVDMCEDIDLEEETSGTFLNFAIPKGYTVDSYMEKALLGRIS